MLLNEFLKQHHKIEEQSQTIHELKEKLTEELGRRDAENAELKGRLERLERLIGSRETVEK